MVLLVKICLFVPVIAPVQATPPQKKEARYCTEVERHVKANREAMRAFGAIHKAGEESFAFDEWKEYATEEEWVKARDAAEGAGDVALVWLREGKVVQANFTFSSSSGDWALYGFYCFSADGTLVRLESTLNTFYGNMKVEREYFYDSEKESFQATLGYLDLETGKPKRPGEEFVDREPPLYRHVASLPFASLLRRPLSK